MAEPFKNLLNPPLVKAGAQHLAQQAKKRRLEFDDKRFVKLASTGLEALELKARAMQIADALEATLPPSFTDAATLLQAALAPPEAGDAMAGISDVGAGLRGWICWPVGEFIARRGLDQPEIGLAALHAMTQRFTAERALRPFIVAHPQLCWATLRRWCTDPSPHVRRLVSEGSRPRLPWGLRLQGLVLDPRPTLPLLVVLQDDASEYVRRSVANHLNDIAKDHPDLVAEWVETHLPNARPERHALLRHASRSLIKVGHARTLAAWGLGQKFRGKVSLQLHPPTVRLGDGLTFTLKLQSTSPQPQRLAIDYVVHHVKADGRTSPKVFKGWQLELAPRTEQTLTKKHPLRMITTRRYHAGQHGLTAQVNGQAVAQCSFVLAL